MKRKGKRPGSRAAAVVAAAVSAAACVSPRAAPVEAQGAVRVQHTLNDGWLYADGPVVGAERPGYDDSGWERVDLPHTWNRGAEAAEGPEYRRGVGWYRRMLELDRTLAGRRLFLHFEGANQVTEVFLNGEPVGAHVGGYTAFTVDITEHVRFDGMNVLAVRVDNGHDPDIPPLDADFTFYGGIYRDVWLVAVNPVHVTLTDHGGPGLYVDTPEVSDDEATVRVRGAVVNDTGRPWRVRVLSRVLDPRGDEVARVDAPVEVPAGGSSAFELRSDPISAPQLWSPAEPNVYTVITEILDGDVVKDRVRSPLGFRWLRVDPDRGAFLNGHPIRLTGTNRHQDRAGYGNALPNTLHRQDIEIVKATGFNFLRLAHYPQDPAVVDAMDRIGLVGWEEIPVVNTITLSEAFAENAERMLREMIRQHYNHPSILFWGYMNEIMLREPDPMPAGYHERVVALAERLEAVVHEEDPGRNTVTAISFGEVDNGTGFQDIPDILGLNLYFGWYYRSLEGLGAWLDSLHVRHPDRPIMISEYGAGSDQRIHAVDPERFDFSTEYQQEFHQVHMPQLLTRVYLAGTAVWNQFDFGSSHRNDSKPNINQKGLLYYDRTPKDVWHYYRALLLDEPVLHIATRDWHRRAGDPGESWPIVVYSNLDSVELRLNDASLGRLAVANGSARWDAILEPGANRLTALGQSQGHAVRDETAVVYEVTQGMGPPETVDMGAPDRTMAADPVVSPGRRVGWTSPAGIAVNAGSHYQYIDAAGTVWQADRPYDVSGGWGYTGGDASLVHERIQGSPEDGLYQATREGARSYRFDVPDGEYDVRILLAETHRQAVARTMSVEINGVPVFTDLDLARRYGAFAAVERTVRVTAEGGAGVRVVFRARTGVPTVSGIEVRRR